MEKVQTPVIPDWAIDSRPGVDNFFAAMALAGLENIPVRLSLGQQIALLGSACFGRQAVTVLRSGGVMVSRSLAFGRDYITGVYTPADIAKAARHGLAIRPGEQGPGLLPQGAANDE